MENNNKNAEENLKKRKKKQIIIAIVTLIVVSIAMFVGFVFYKRASNEKKHRESFGTSIDNNDYEFVQNIGVDTIVLTITPKIAIKNFEFVIFFYGPTVLHQYTDRKEIAFAEVNIPIIYKYSVDFIEMELSNWKLEKIDLGNISGMKKNS